MQEGRVSWAGYSIPPEGWVWAPYTSDGPRLAWCGDDCAPRRQGPDRRFGPRSEAVKQRIREGQQAAYQRLRDNASRA